APGRTRHQQLPARKLVTSLLGDSEADRRRCLLRSHRRGGHAPADNPRPGQEKERNRACRSPDTEPQHSFNMALSSRPIKRFENVGPEGNEDLFELADRYAAGWRPRDSDDDDAPAQPT